jgi:hypothetical protein
MATLSSPNYTTSGNVFDFNNISVGVVLSPLPQLVLPQVNNTAKHTIKSKANLF